MSETEQEILELTDRFKESLFAITGREWDVLLRKKGALLKPEFIIEMVSQKLHIPVDNILSHSRKGPIQDANRVATWLVLQNCGLHLNEVGRVFNRDHSSIVVRRGRHQDLMITDKTYKRKFEMCKL